MPVNSYIDHTLLKADANEEQIHASMMRLRNINLQVFASIQHG